MGIYSVDCAACGSGPLRRVASKTRGDNCGFCRRCKVFVCDSCGTLEKGLWGWRDCPSCRSRLKGSTGLFYTMSIGITIGLLFAWISWSSLGNALAQTREAEMVEHDPADLVADGETTKFAGRVAPGEGVVIHGRLEPCGKSTCWKWYPEEFHLVGASGTNFTVDPYQLKLSGTVDILKSHRPDGSYVEGDSIVVIGVVHRFPTGTVLDARRIAQTSSDLAGLGYGFSAWTFASSSLLIVAGGASTVVFVNRSRDHDRRRGGFKKRSLVTGPAERPAGKKDDSQAPGTTYRPPAPGPNPGRPARPARSRICTQCFVPNEMLAAKCAGCGDVLLPPRRCRRCGTLVPPEFRTCLDCGSTDLAIR